MNKINECDIRRMILQRTDLSAAVKLTVFALLLKVDWGTWRGVATLQELMRLSALSRRSIQNSLKQLEAHKLITRSWSNVNGRVLPVIALDAHAMMSKQETQGGAKSARGCKICTCRGAKSARGGCKICTARGAKSAPLQLNNYKTINLQLDQPHSAFKNTDIDTEQTQTKHNALPKTTHTLTAEMIKTIESHGSNLGHAERVDIAKLHLNIKLLKGGFYEQI